MFRRSVTLFACLIAVMFGLNFTSASAATAKNHSLINGKTQAGSSLVPHVTRSAKNDSTIPLRNMNPIPIKASVETHEIKNNVLPRALNSVGKSGQRNAPVKSTRNPGKMPGTFRTFEGSNDDLCQCAPPDTNGDVGPNNYVQIVNVGVQMFDKSGNSLLGPELISTLWQGFGGACENNNTGDPIALYDQLADRWLISQFVLFQSDGNHQCVAVSQTGDPTGAYNRYDFNVGDLFNDYPHLGVWPDGYYMTVNQFNPSGTAFVGAGVYSFERDKMLLGQSAQVIYFDLGQVDLSFGGMLPSDLDGPAPTAGTPNVFADMQDDAFGSPTDRLELWDFHVDWVTPSNSTFGINGEPNTHLDTAPFDADMCGFSRNCIPEPGTSTALDAISDRLMHRLQYRTFGAYSTLVGNHTVDADGNDHAGVDWFELRNSGSGWSIHQEGIYAPDSDNRWMGSAAMDGAGNIALGYSVSSSSTFPSIRYAGRLSSDPLGQMSQGENTILAGTASQTNGLSRWGDYSGLSVDPSPGNFGGIDCDFWYTNEYLQQTGSFNWNTRVGAFSFAPGACGGPHGDLQGTVTDNSTTLPISGATVTVQPGGFTTTTNGSGVYHFTLAVGTYDVKASDYGYISQTHTSIGVTDGGTTNENFALNLAPHVTVSGTVTDGSGHGWPLYARIDISGDPFGPFFTNPTTGAYSVDLLQDTPYTFNVNAIAPGYSTGIRAVTPPSGGSTEDFALTVNASTCNAPGYHLTGGLSESFDSGTKPAGWTVIDNEGNGEVWTFVDPEGQSNNTGGTGLFAVINSDFFGSGEMQDTELRTPVMDFSAQSVVHLEFDTDFNYFGFPTAEIGDTDVSSDGGSTWTNVLSYTGEVSGPHHENLDISSIAGNQSNVMARFHYYNATWEFWWQVDNVKVGVGCTPISGGLVVGNVFDGNTNLGLNGATVFRTAVPSENTTSFATPNDPNVKDGYYILFSSVTGVNSFKAKKNQYGTTTHNVNVTADQLVLQNFILTAGKIVPNPTLLQDTVQLGTQDVQPLNLNNTGGRLANFELQEGNGNTNAPQTKVKGDGPPLNLIKGHFSPLRQGANLAHSQKTKLIKGEDKDKDAKEVDAPKAPPWTDIAGYPSSIMDNACAAIEGKIYCVGGFDGGNNLSSGAVYDPGADSWSAIASMSDIREKPVAVAIDGKLYVTGGWDSTGNPDSKLEIYDPAGDSWTTGASIPTPYAAPTGVNLDGKFYVIGGCDSATCGFTEVQVYDPAGDSWSTAADYPEPISWNACGATGGLIYCAGGVANNESKHTYSYDPGSDSWTPLADMPQSQWAMGFTVSDDKLYISGGVTNNFATITNQGFVYDPGADSWTAIENSNNTLYRGGSACGLYKVGGDTGGFAPVPDSEVYPGLTNCEAAADVPWLSEAPTSGPIGGHHSQLINVTFDAAQVTQPGDYLAHLRIKEDTPYTTPDVQVIMHVPLPAGWGYLAGTVTGQLRCDQPGSALNKATVFVDTASGPDYTLQTDASGHYSVAFDASTGPTTITVSHNGYVTIIRNTVSITAGITTTEDFDLRLDAPCIDVQPTTLETTVALGSTDLLSFNMDNSGAGAADYQIKEGAGNTAAPQKKVAAKGAPLMRIQGTYSPLSLNALRKGSERDLHVFAPSKAPRSSKDAPWLDIANFPTSVMDNTCAEIDGLIYCLGGIDGGFSTLNSGSVYDPNSNSWTSIASMSDAREKPAVAAIDGKLYVTGGWDSSGTPDGTLEIYDPGSDSWSSGATNPTPFAASTGVNLDGLFYVIGGCDSGTCGKTNVQVYDPSGDSWSSAANYPEPISWNACADISGLIYCAGGVATNESQHTYSYDSSSDSWTQLADIPQTQWAMGFTNSDDLLYISGGVTNNFGTVTNEGFVYDPNADSWTSIANSNNSLYRGGSACGFYKVGGSSGGFTPDASSEVLPGLTNCGGAADIPWLTESPDSGTLDADTGHQQVDVTFDAGQVTQPGDYLAHLKIKTSYSLPNVNAIMHVPLPADWGYLSGTVTGLGRCDVGSSPLNKATVVVTFSTSWGGYVLQTDANGQYLVAFPIFAGPATVTVNANGYVSQTKLSAVVNHNTTTILDFTLRLDAPCADKSPTSLEVTLNSDESMTLPLTLKNTGAGGLDFKIQETSFGLPPLRPVLKKATPRKVKQPIKAGPRSILSQRSKMREKVSMNASKAWFSASPLPGGVVHYAHTQCDTQPNSFYIFSGVDGTFSLTSNSWRFDAASNTWNALAPIPVGAEGPTATCYQGRIYVMGGSFDGGDGSDNLFIYDIASNTWFSGASLPRPVVQAASSSWNGKVYLIGGDVDFFLDGTSNEVDVYDIASDTWTGTGSSMPVAAAEPGYVQAGNNVYVVGGIDDSVAPSSNLVASQRYDMDADAWSTGTDLPSGRADLALSITDTALYVMGGDDDGGSFFDPTDTVTRLDWTGWPAGSWTTLDSMPTKYTSNNAGFCTQAIAAGSEVWSVGGISTNFTIDGTAFFRPSQTEHCYSIFSDVPWLSETPTSDTVSPDSNEDVAVQFSGNGMPGGDYNAVLVVTTNDSGAPQFNIPVTMHINSTPPSLFFDDFNDGDYTTPLWTVKSPSVWSAASGDLVGTSLKKADAYSPTFGTGGCTTCTVLANISASTDKSKVSVFGWWQDKKHYVEVRLNIGKGKVQLFQRAGSTVAKGTGNVTLPPGNYTVQVAFDGTNFNVQISGDASVSFSVPKGATPLGTVAFRVKGSGSAATATLKDITVF